MTARGVIFGGEGGGVFFTGTRGRLPYPWHVAVQSCQLASPFTLSAPKAYALTGGATKANREPTLASSSASTLSKGRESRLSLLALSRR